MEAAQANRGRLDQPQKLWKPAPDSLRLKELRGMDKTYQGELVPSPGGQQLNLAFALPGAARCGWGSPQALLLPHGWICNYRNTGLLASLVKVKTVWKRLFSVLVLFLTASGTAVTPLLRAQP